MSRKLAGIAFALCLAAAWNARADDSDAKKSCIAAWTTSCSRDCATSRCVSSCTTQAHNQCSKDVTQPQRVFVGPVTSTPIVPPGPCTPNTQNVQACIRNPTDLTIDSVLAEISPVCSLLSGTVANKSYWGGSVAVYVICPGRETSSTSVIGQTCSNPNDGSFSLQATRACGGQTGCYGVIAAAPPGDNAFGCGNDIIITNPPAPGDPGWNTCTNDACPSP